MPLEELEKSIGEILIRYEDSIESIKKITDYQEREGKRAVRLIMAINDIKALIK